MKITDKIVTSITLPQQTNVLWHNPETGELKMFGNNGWEVAGGNPGNGGSGGYPVVTVEDDFNITAEPNTFYNIKNSADSEVNINFKSEEFYTTGKNKYIIFTFDDLNNSDEIILMLSSIGGIIVEDNSVEGYKYRMDMDGSLLDVDIIPVYLSNNITEGTNIRAYINILGVEKIVELNNIHIINKNIDYLYYISLIEEDYTINVPHVILEEVENDSEFKYKYKYYGVLNIMLSSEYLYTNEPINEATSIFINNEGDCMELLIANKILNKDIKPSNIANEFVFNIISPTNIIFNKEIKWNNGSTPDFSQKGIFTISIINGVGCYTFVNN